ncbi:MAG: hypothetical protein HY072_04240 [Deltaproteobacteria bacterium]|nr:hypothetical protein [Deltaproteobacteria bacterium]
MIPEDEDFTQSPYTEYGEFNIEEEENETTRFLQQGRFFGVSLGSGIEGVTGNRGLLWQKGSPMIDFRIHYWFDFNLALDLGLFSVPHFYEFKRGSSDDHVDVNIIFVGVTVKYYFDVQNLSAALTFANPFLTIGGGIFYKTENSRLLGTSDTDNTMGLNIGGGLEFPIKAKKIFFTLESRFYTSNFSDTFTGDFMPSLGIPNLTGNFYTLTANLLFTW